MECGCKISMLAKTGHVAQLGYFFMVPAGSCPEGKGREGKGGHTHSHTQSVFFGQLMRRCEGVSLGRIINGRKCQLGIPS